MKEYNRLLGLHLDDVKEFFDNKNIKYTITEIRGRKDKDKLIIPRVIKISQRGVRNCIGEKIWTICFLI